MEKKGVGKTAPQGHTGQPWTTRSRSPDVGKGEQCSRILRRHRKISAVPRWCGREAVMERLANAKELIGDLDALKHFADWKPPLLQGSE